MINLSLFEVDILGHLYNSGGGRGVPVQTPLNSWLGPKLGILTLCISVFSQHRQAVVLVA